jgi:hypothetical protein
MMSLRNLLLALVFLAISAAHGYVYLDGDNANSSRSPFRPLVQAKKQALPRKQLSGSQTSSNMSKTSLRNMTMNVFSERDNFAAALLFTRQEECPAGSG